MKKLKSKHGMTIAELLIVIAIIAVLSGVAFVSVWTYQRSLGQVERDGIAKEIFVAAQNHLTAAYGEGYPGVTDFGTPGTAEEDAGKDVYYFAVNGSISDSSALGRMLPFGSIDETVRMGGSYIVRYQKGAGLVLDVFYCTTNASPSQFNRDLTGLYAEALALKDSETGSRKQQRRNWDGHILGWYGGTDAASLAAASGKIEPPQIKVVNAEKLSVTVTNPNTIITDSAGTSFPVSVRLQIKGLSSNTEHYLDLTIPNSSQEIILDDVTATNVHFANLSFDDMTPGTGNGFIPGENIEIQAVAFSTNVLANIAYSNKVITNSLFESIANQLDAAGAPISASSTDKLMETAYIGNIRHLENLDKLVSGLSSRESASDDKLELFKITNAVQTSNMSWSTFKTATGGDSTVVYGVSGTALTEAGGYYPIDPSENLLAGESLTYDGRSHSVSDVVVRNNANAGLFSATTKVSEIKNLELIDFSVTGATSAGALAGTLKDCNVANVLARNTTNADATNITAPTAGGLIGVLDGGTLQYSAAAVIVNGSTTAGGLVGTAGGAITGCYSGGHTASGSYGKWVKTHPYDVTGGTAGGLAGSSTAAISDSYSTCSVSGTTAGGFAGSASGSIENCYATGLIDQSNSGATVYAFLADGSASLLSGNYYYRVINEVEIEKNGKTVTEPMLPYPNAGAVSDHLSKAMPLDLNADSYNSFTGAWDDWNPARVYDSPLVTYYEGKYCLRTVDELNSTVPTDYDSWNQLFISTHYGDWPSPEVFFINT